MEFMTNQQISVIINLIRFTNNLTSLQKDILDTWNELQKNPFDSKSAYKQIVNNNINHPDMFTTIRTMPDVITKSAETLTLDDMIFTLNRQIEVLVTKEMITRTNCFQ